MKVSAQVERARERATALQAWVEQTLWWRIWQRLLENEFLDRSVALAAKAFVSLFPALIVVAAFTPDSTRHSILSTITNRLGLSGEGLNTVKSAFATSDDVKRATGIVGLLFTFFYVNSFVAALQRVYTKSWRRPPGGRVSGYALAVAWLVAVVAYFALLGAGRRVFGSGPTTPFFALVALALTWCVWTLSPWFLLQRQVRLRALVPVGLLTGTGMLVYAASANVWMPNTVTQNQHQFGFFGVALALVTWLTGAATIIVVSTCAGAVLAEDTGMIGRLVRGGDDAPFLKEGAKPSLPAPVVPQTIGRAFGVPARDEEDAEIDLTRAEQPQHSTRE